MFVKVFASGTNIKRVAKAAGGNVDISLFASYSTLEATEPGIVKRKFFCTDVSDVSATVQAFKDEDQPTWSKIWKAPNKNKPFISTLVKRLAGQDEDTLDERLNLSAMVNGASGETVRCFMLLTSADKAGMDQAAKIIADALPTFAIKVLNGNHTTNEKAEAEVKTLIRDQVRAPNGELAKEGLILITNQMASRSFSVSEIEATVIAYDRGAVDALEQKNSRCLTPGRKLNGEVKDFGAIVDLGFDTNRSENTDLLVLNEILMVQREQELESFSSAAKIVLNSMNLFRVDGYGRVKVISEEEMTRRFSEADNLLEIVNITADINTLVQSDIGQRLAVELAGLKDAKSGKKATLTKNAKSTITEGGKNNSALQRTDEKELKNLQAIMNRAIKAINQSATSVALMVLDGDSFQDCIAKIVCDDGLSEEFEDLWGVRPQLVLEVVELGVLNLPILDTLVMLSKNIDYAT
jgi:hypothetical protein